MMKTHKLPIANMKNNSILFFKLICRSFRTHMGNSITKKSSKIENPAPAKAK